MPRAKMHFTRDPYAPHAACQWDRTRTPQVTTDISEVTCRTCLSAIIPAKYRTFTLEELRDRAIKFNK